MRAIPIVVAERMSPATEDFRTAIVAANGVPGIDCGCDKRRADGNAECEMDEGG